MATSLHRLLLSLIGLAATAMLLGFQYMDAINSWGGSKKISRLIIVSSWHSGSKFVAEALNAELGAFYHYEPLFAFGIKQGGRTSPTLTVRDNDTKMVEKALDREEGQHTFR